MKISREHHIPIVATNDSHYLALDDNEAQDLLSCIGDGRTVEDPDRPTLIEGNYALRSSDEMAEIFAHVPEAIKNSEKIAEAINLEIYGKTLIPKFELDSELQKEYEKYLSGVPEGAKRLSEEEWNLRNLCYAGLNHRYNFGIDEATIVEFIHKLDIPPSEKRLSDMSLPELIERSESYQTEKKKEIIASLDDYKKERINRIEYGNLPL